MSEEKQEYNVKSVPTNQAAREKYWDELSIEEKIERTRWVVKVRMDAMERRLQRIDAQLTQLAQHSHSPRGLLVVPMPTRFGPFGAAESDRAEPTHKGDKEFF